MLGLGWPMFFLSHSHSANELFGLDFYANSADSLTLPPWSDVYKVVHINRNTYIYLPYEPAKYKSKFKGVIAKKSLGTLTSTPLLNSQPFLPFVVQVIISNDGWL